MAAMQVAEQPRARVGVAPGTTTFQLAGPQASVVCDDGSRARYQRMREYPPWKVRAAQAAQRVQRVLDPYGTIESLKGGLGRLGLVLAPYGNRAPNTPSVQITQAGAGAATCSPNQRPSAVNDYRAGETVDYGFQITDHSPHGGLGRPGAPTDLELSKVWGYTPFISGWIPFKEGNWAPAPWSPPDGGYGQLAGPRAQRLGDVTDTVVTPPQVPVDPATATLQTLQMHQDRMYLLGIISAAAVASTALVNVFRYSTERRDQRKRHTRVAAEPAPSIAGWRRRQRRR